jgi:hypothetical protein
MNSELPRGVRNNNPGNINRDGTKWKGMSLDQSGDPRFIVFDRPEWGIRAIGKILLHDQSIGICTVRGAITRYAPSVENDTAAYIASVCRSLGVGPDDRVDLTNPRVMTALIEAIIAVECSRYEYPPAAVEQGVGLALGTMEA